MPRRLLKALVSATWIFGAALAAVAPAAATAASPATQAAQSCDASTPVQVVMAPREIRTIAIGVEILSLIVLDGEPVAAEATGTSLRLTGQRVGETAIIVTTVAGRRTIVVSVTGRPVDANAERRARDRTWADSPVHGSYSLLWAPALGTTSGRAGFTFDYTRAIDAGHTLHVEGDMFRVLQTGAVPLTSLPTLEVNRLQVALTAPAGTLTVFDSTMSSSRLGLNGYAMRGVRLEASDTFVVPGLEVFAGVARPAFGLFGDSRAAIYGAFVPIIRTADLRVRTGFIVTKPSLPGERGGGVVQMDARFAPDAHTTIEGEVAYSPSSLSARAAVALERGNFSFAGEALHLDDDSPLVAAGAQSSGQDLLSGSVFWRPTSHLSGSVSFTRVENASHRDVGRNYRSSSFRAGLGLSVVGGGRLSLQYQTLATQATLAAPAFDYQQQSNTVSLDYSTPLPGRMTSSFSVRRVASYASDGNDGLATSWGVRETLNRSWARASAAAFFSYSNEAQSPIGFVLRNSSRLPPELRRAYEADPAAFLAQGPVAISSLLGTFDIGESRRLESGVRGQARFSRLLLGGDVRYAKGDVFGRPSSGIVSSATATVRLDPANTFSVAYSHALPLDDSAPRTAITVGYSHAFGSSSGGGYEPLSVLGLDRGRVEGRVFADANGDGRDDASETGIPGVSVQLDGGETAKTDERGVYGFGRIASGSHTVSLVSGAVGTEYRVSTPTSQGLTVMAHATAVASFGVTSYGSVAGRVFNDLALAGAKDAGSMPGVGGVHLLLRRAGDDGRSAPLRPVVTTGSGHYEFAGLTPGAFDVELERESLPTDYRVPENTSWHVTVTPTGYTYLDVPIAALRSVSGIVFEDVDGDGRFTPDVDRPAADVVVSGGGVEVVTGATGAYVLRNLPAGKLTVLVRSRSGVRLGQISVELGAEPASRRGTDIPVPGTAPEPKADTRRVVDLTFGGARMLIAVACAWLGI